MSPKTWIALHMMALWNAVGFGNKGEKDMLKDSKSNGESGKQLALTAARRAVEQIKTDRAKPQRKKTELEILEDALKARRVRGESTTTIEWDLTPSLAAELIASNNVDRELSSYIVAQYRSDMSSGSWRMSHQGIAVGPKMERGDGQHRCHACDESGVTIRVSITQYHDQSQFNEAKKTWDLMRRRSKANALELSGKVKRGQGKAVASALEAIAAVDASHPAKPTSEEAVAMWRPWKNAITATLEMNPYKFMAYTRAAFAIAYKKHPAEVSDLIAKVVNMAGYAEGSAAHSIVKNLDALQKIGKSHTERRLSTARMLNLIFRHVRGQSGVGLTKGGQLRISEEALSYFLNGNWRQSAEGKE